MVLVAPWDVIDEIHKVIPDEVFSRHNTIAKSVEPGHPSIDHRDKPTQIMFVGRF